jgi:hypothetical protein
MLVPELAEAIVNEQQPEGVTLRGLLEGVPAACGEQRVAFPYASGAAELPPAFWFWQSSQSA